MKDYLNIDEIKKKVNQRNKITLNKMNVNKRLNKEYERMKILSSKLDLNKITKFKINFISDIKNKNKNNSRIEKNKIYNSVPVFKNYEKLSFNVNNNEEKLDEELFKKIIKIKKNKKKESFILLGNRIDFTELLNIINCISYTNINKLADNLFLIQNINYFSYSNDIYYKMYKEKNDYFSKMFNYKFNLFNLRKLRKNEFFINFESQKNNENIFNKCLNIYSNEIINLKNNCENSYGTFIYDYSYNNFYGKKLKFFEYKEMDFFLSNKLSRILKNKNENSFLKTNFLLNTDKNKVKHSLNDGQIPVLKQLQYFLSFPRKNLPLFLYEKNEDYKLVDENLNKKDLDSKLHFIIEKKGDLFYNNSIINKNIFMNNRTIQENIKSNDILSGTFIYNNSFSNSLFNTSVNKNHSFGPKLIKEMPPLINLSKRKKRTYNQMIEEYNNNFIENNKKLILINNKTIGYFIYKKNEFILINDMKEKIDVIFDLNICGNIFYLSEFEDKLESSGYCSIINLINKNYIKFSKFFLFMINDIQIKRKSKKFIDEIINNIKENISSKFNNIIKSPIYHLAYFIKIIDNPHMINNEIEEIYNNLNLYIENDISLYKNNIYKKLLEELTDKFSAEGNNISKFIIENENKNSLEIFLLNNLKNNENIENVNYLIKNKFDSRILQE